ncbi:MAG TPA: sugar phosphate isomerase/epimerase [Tepidisphaeraceae bacterium]|jgi:sugar phosphate isomerase/epimerase|nr:sugar phosphate isomerase/epimerase [Tepidisphaeraceae bacterium]
MSLLRNFALAGAALTLSITAIGVRAEAPAAPAAVSSEPLVIPDEYKTNGWAIGCQAWSWNHFSVMEAIEKTHEVGGKIIEFYPGQMLRKDQPAVSFSHNSPDAVLDQVKAQLKKYNILAVSYGVVGLPNDEKECRKVFEFAHKMGLRTVVSEPDPKAMDIIEKLVKEYDICMAIHDHPKRDNDPNYKYWDPNYVLSLVKDRDPRIGSCADIGHWVRSGVRPLDALKILKGRIIESHLKDINRIGEPHGHDVPFGNGVSEITAVLDELKRQNFQGNLSIEYEFHQENPTTEITECIEFVQRYGKPLWPDSEKH